MAHLYLIRQGEYIRIGLFPAQGADGQGGNKLLAALGQNSAHGHAPLAHPPDQVKALIGRNTAANDQ